METDILKQWLTENHPTILEIYEDSFADLIELDFWLEEYYGWVDQEFRVWFEKNYACFKR